MAALIATGTGQARVLTRARILLAADRDDTDAAIGYAVHVHPHTVPYHSGCGLLSESPVNVVNKICTKMTR